MDICTGWLVFYGRPTGTSINRLALQSWENCQQIGDEGDGKHLQTAAVKLLFERFKLKRFKLKCYHGVSATGSSMMRCIVARKRLAASPGVFRTALYNKTFWYNPPEALVTAIRDILRLPTAGFSQPEKAARQQDASYLAIN